MAKMERPLADEATRTDWTAERTKRAHEAHDALSDFINVMGHDDDEFVEEFLRNHRTLQQGEVGLMLRCLYALAEQDDEHGGDLRNEAARQAAQKVREALGPTGWAMPFI
jgi:hypothetical protein